MHPVTAFFWMFFEGRSSSNTASGASATATSPTSTGATPTTTGSARPTATGRTRTRACTGAHARGGAVAG